jgi:DNA-binding XRE family transcriptional regulator
MDDMITITRAEHEALVDARDYALAMRAMAAGAPTIAETEVDDFLAAPSAIAFFRQRAGMTQVDLARKLHVNQPYLAQLEHGRRKGGIEVYLRLARLLGVRVEDLADAK